MGGITRNRLQPAATGRNRVKPVQPAATGATGTMGGSIKLISTYGKFISTYGNFQVRLQPGATGAPDRLQRNQPGPLKLTVPACSSYPWEDAR